MKYAEETYEEIQVDGSIVLRKVIVPIYVPADQEISQERPWRGVEVVKTHNKTGLKYLGKTISTDPHLYQGSGTL